ncbi:hypothetical protein O181_094628 [Austropuccinia psidii MF-1]|uniref:Uncharacterized protein n=1 Tax=Austropuccinia psidii MF-1 TaxID=1389203 RepID=A0A9Q3PAF7_9BASI|nr:hypothetical protein [Austropuccinia psidii MF-1]
MFKGARARLGEVEDEEGEEFVEEEDSGETEVEDTFLLKIIEQMATIIGQLSQAASPRDNSKAPAFKTPSMKVPDPFDGTQAHKLSFSLVELASGLNPTFQILPMKTLPTSSIIGSYLKLNYSLCLVISMKSGKRNKSWII